jgi:cystathionine gamma-synthase
MRDDTKFVKAGETPDAVTGSISTPIHQTVSYLHPRGDAYRYSRERNPTVDVLAKKIAEAEACDAGTCFSSGMAAESTLFLALLSPGSKLVIQKDVFGRTLRFAREFLTKWGVNVSVAQPGNQGVLDAINNNECDMVFVESVTNPVLRVTDIAAVSEAAHKKGAILVVDNTLPTPVNLKPFTQGADLVVHSASKFIAGHNDVVAGLVAGKPDLVEKIDDLRKTVGCVMDPHAAFLVIRGVKTLGARMQTINGSALKIAEFLRSHPKVDYVRYPGLKSDSDHELAKRIFRGFGGIVSFVLKSTRKSAPEDFMMNLKLVYPANTFGAVDSVISHPSTMSHRNLSEEERIGVGIPWNLMRLSVGLENVDDLIDDLDQALSKT